MSESVPREPGVHEAKLEILALEQQVLQGGSVDSESNALHQILVELETGKIKPSEAIAQARSLLASRQDYH